MPRSVSKIVGSLLAIAVVLALSAPLFAQRLDGTLRGSVEDPSGAAVVGAKVTATNEATGVATSTETSTAGVYVFPNLLAGKYTVKVTAPSFSTYVSKGVQVMASQSAEADIRLQVGAADTTVEVTAGSELIQTENSTISNTFNYQSLQSLPGGTNALNLAILLPNTTAAVGGTAGSGGSVGGTRPRMNNFTIDGTDDNDVSVTGPMSTVISDAVEEFDVNTNQYSAEYGHSAGGQFMIISKSGTNAWHGNAFWFLRNKKLNAMTNLEKCDDPLASPCPAGQSHTRSEMPRYDHNIGGFSVGGPVIKDKFFVFGALQKDFFGTAGQPTAAYDAPTASGLAALNALAVNGAVQDILAQFPVASTGTSLVNVCRLNNDGTQNVCSNVEMGSGVGFVPDFSDEWDFHINGDLNLSNHRISTRYLYNHFRSPLTPDGIPLAQFSGSVAYDIRKALAKDTWNINNRLVNDLTLAWTLQNGSNLTVPGGFANFPNVQINDLSNFYIGPYSVAPQGGKINTYQIMEQMSWVTGKHTLKFGVELRKWIGKSDFLPRARGEWQYPTLSELVSDLVPLDFAKRGAGSGAFVANQSAVYWYVQDDFKVTPRLTLNLGVRYEFVGNPKSANLQVLNEIATLPGVFEFNKPKTDNNNFAPRVGFAWDPTGSGKWAIRGGFGMAYDVTFQNLPLLQLPPQLQSEQDPDITCGLPGAPGWCANWDPNNPGTKGFGQGFLANGGLLQVNVPPANQAEARGGTQGVILDTIAPKVYTWSLGVQRQLTSRSSIEVRYLGTSSRNLPIQVQANSRTAFRNGASPLPMFGSSAEALAAVGLGAGSPTLAEFQSFIGRPYAADGFLGSVTTFPSIGSADYHGGSVNYILRPWHGLTLNTNYTFSKNIDDSTNELFTSQVNPRRMEDKDNLANERARSVLDVTHKFALSFTYELPKFSPDSNFLAKGVLNGWAIGSTYLLQSGQPLTVLSFRDVNGNGDSAGDRAWVNPANRTGTGSESGFVCNVGGIVSTSAAGCPDPDGAPDPLIPGSNPLTSADATIGYYALDGSAQFVRARPGVVTNQGRNNISSPGLNNWNIQILKNTHITESKYIQFRAEFFNAFNHRQFSYANSTIFSDTDQASFVTNPVNPGFGSTGEFRNFKALNGGSRTIQLGLKFFF